MTGRPKTIVWQFYYNDLSNAAEFEKWLTQFNHLTYSHYLAETRGVFLWQPGAGKDEQTWLYFPDVISGAINAILSKLKPLISEVDEKAVELPIKGKGRFLISIMELPGRERTSLAAIREGADQFHLKRSIGQVEYSMPLDQVMSILEREILRAARACQERGSNWS